MTYPPAIQAEERGRLPTGELRRDARVGFAICDPGLSFGAIVGLGAKERAVALGVQLSIVSAFTPEQLAAVIDGLIADGVDVLIVEAVESEIVVPAISRAGAAGIPVIVADMRIHGVEPACTVRSDNVKGGELAARYLVDRLQRRGVIAHLQGLLTSDNGLDRSRGFHDVVDQETGIRVVETSSEWTTHAGAAAMRELLTADPDLQAVFANNDALALGAVAAIGEAGRTGEIVVVGFDALPNALLAVEEGTMAATVRQMPRAMGRIAVELALRVHSGEHVPSVVETDVALVTAESVAEASLATLPLFPHVLLELTESGDALSEERMLLRTLIDNLPDLIYVKDEAGRFLVVNTATLRHFGAVRQEDVVGKTDFDFFPLELASRYRADEQALRESGRPLINHEERSPDATGVTHWLSTTKVLVRDGTGRAVGLIGVNRDITERKRAEVEQAALRRLAMRVAQGATATELFAAVVEEVAEVLELDRVMLARFGPDRTMTVLASVNEGPFTVGSRWPLDGPGVAATVLDTGHPARIDDYTDLPGTVAAGIRASQASSLVGVPIVVDGKVWGVLVVTAGSGGLVPADADDRLLAFGELVATALSNAESRDRLRALADEQASLRRVATLVAEGGGATEVFDAVCEETGRLVGATSVNLSHYTPDGFNVTMAGWSLRDTHVPVGTRFPVSPDTIGGTIVRTNAPTRMDSWEGATSELALLVRARGIRSSVGAPVMVDGQLWGALVAATDGDETLPAGTELRLARFTELIAIAISNATTRSALIASRARIVSAGDEARRRIERNLHDGTQQRLIALGLDLQRARAGIPEDQRETHATLEQMERDLESILEDLRELSHGLHPPLLARRGLRSSLQALARRSPIPVDVNIHLSERPPASLETAVYYVISEALTNAVKHSHASEISVTITTDDAGGPFGVDLDGRRRVGNLRATIVDDGIGGADPGEGSGLTGLFDRVDALGGHFAFDSPPRGGTRISVELPLESPATL